MQARYYDPVIGRFYSNDPIAFRDIHSFNRYAYANNNPYKYTDPNGKNPCLIFPWGTAACAIGAGAMIIAGVEFVEDGAEMRKTSDELGDLTEQRINCMINPRECSKEERDRLFKEEAEKRDEYVDEAGNTVQNGINLGHLPPTNQADLVAKGGQTFFEWLFGDDDDDDNNDNQEQRNEEEQ
ncbi:MAG: hypothetical protein ACJA0H_001286 [Francisellaceae bacterium]|jgi:uncharacterized protein RhaS with RHS repeats